MTHIDYEPLSDCKNPDSYGMICVKCNECGRFTGKGDTQISELPPEAQADIDELFKEGDSVNG